MSGPTRDQAARWLSRERWAWYLRAANNDHEAALALYRWNARASASLLELLSYLEVILRHRVDEVLMPLEVPTSARLSAGAGWWFASETFVESDVVNELWRQHLKDVFPHRPRGTVRAWVSKTLEELRQLRNRIAHHEAIHDLDLATSAERALEIIGWMDPQARAWVADAVRVGEVLGERPVPPEPVAVVVAAGKAWPMYGTAHAYVCQTGRSFRQVSHVAFYTQGSIQAEVAQVVSRRDRVPFSSGEIGRLMATKETADRRLALVMKNAMNNGWDDPTYQVFVLTRPGEQGHVTLGAPIVHQVGGRGAWTQGHRYAPVADLASARTTKDLSPWPIRGGAHVDLTSVDLDTTEASSGPGFVIPHQR